MNILFRNDDGKVTDLSPSLGPELSVRIITLVSQMIRISSFGPKTSITYRAKDLKFEDENIYVELIKIVWENLMLGSDIDKSIF